MTNETEQSPVVGYFSMEVFAEPSLPTYSGGLGVLAGDVLRAAADLGVPMVGITLLHRKGYFHQRVDAQGNQSEEPVDWEPEKLLQQMTPRVTITVEGRRVWIRAWRHQIRGVTENDVAVYFLDTALDENGEYDRRLTDVLYGGDDRYRLCQELVLGFGGVAMLRALGYREIETFHMNEGHSALLALSLLREEAEHSGLPVSDKRNIDRVREQCVFTTHTPVPAGIDKFPSQLVRRVLGDELLNILVEIDCLYFDTLNMTSLALFFSRYINGVSMRHEEVSTSMYPNYPINSVSNGVHAVTWTSDPFRRLYDRRVPEWRYDNLYLRYMISAPLEEIHQAHLEAKQQLLDMIEQRTGTKLNPSVMTLGFARRVATYKRADMLFTDLDRLRKIVKDSGPLQIIFGGKAHPNDAGGKAMMRKVFQAAAAINGVLPFVFLEDYDAYIGRNVYAGVDLWLNTPRKPEEASGTSGMKAALNGVPSLSTLDGWWVEGHIEGITGWSMGESWQDGNPAHELSALYDKLERLIVPMFYREQRAYDSVMRAAIAINGSYYNAQRMVFQYLEHAYMPMH